MAQLTNLLVMDALRIAGLVEAKAALTVPLCTGMALGLTLLGLRLHWKSPPERRVVLWSRIDQKSCLKAIVTSGFTAVVIPQTLVGDECRTDLAALQAALEEHGDRVFCVVTCASCFAPRVPDDLEGVARLCSAADVGHVVNNAHGLQCAATMKKLSRAMRVGRVDAVVQSTDKNFLVPVGGAVIASGDKGALEAIGQVLDVLAIVSPCSMHIPSVGWARMCGCMAGVSRPSKLSADTGPFYHAAFHGRPRVTVIPARRSASAAV